MKTRTVLIVDDEPFMRTMMKETLMIAGYAVLLAEGGTDALRILEHEKVPVMIFDLKMPGMNGLELCAAVKRRYPTAIIYAMSGYHSLFDLVDCLGAGFEDYFAKPFDFDLIRQEVAHAFGKVERWKRL